MVKKKDKKAKKDKKSVSTINYKQNFNFSNGDLFSRMNYLLRISDALYKQSDNGGDKKEHNILSRLYISIMKDISKRNAIRIDKHIKKITCSKCNNLLYKSANSEIKFINKSGKHVLQIKCCECGNVSEEIYF